MSFTLISRNRQRAKSVKVLRGRVAYLEDQKHKSHVGKIIYPAHNLNCGASGEDFVAECVRADDAYQAHRIGKRGRPADGLFIEIVYSSPTGAHLTDLERDSIAKISLNQFARNTACRYAWHVNSETGRADLHILLAAKDDDYPPKISLWRDFGGTNGAHLYASMDRLGTSIVKDLNKGRSPEMQLKSAEQVHKERIINKKPDLAAELAPLNLSQAELAEGIISLGYDITKETDKNISVFFPNSKRPSRFNKSELLRKIAEVPVVDTRPTGGGETGTGKGGGIPPGESKKPASPKPRKWKPKKQDKDKKGKKHDDPN
jgi:hypothetical protein